jgi:hypothetical protein
MHILKLNRLVRTLRYSPVLKATPQPQLLCILMPLIIGKCFCVFIHHQHCTVSLNSAAWVRERTIPTKRPPLVEVSTNFCRWRVPLGQRDRSLWPYSRLSRPDPLLFLPSSSSVVLTRMSGPRSRPTTSQKIW